MDTTTLLSRISLGNPLTTLDGLVDTALASMGDVGADDIATAQRAVQIITAAKPTRPDPDGRRIVADLSDLMVRAALRGEEPEVLGQALERVALFDAAHVQHAAWVAADHSARRHLARTVARHSTLAFRAWTQQAKDLGAAYADALAGQPYPDVEQALRAGGKAAARLARLEETLAAYERTADSWRAMRLLLGSGQDRGVYELTSRFDRPPAAKTFEKVAFEIKGTHLTVLDIAARYDLTDALTLDSLADCDERETRWIAEMKERRTRQGSLAGATPIATADINGGSTTEMTYQQIVGAGR